MLGSELEFSLGLWLVTSLRVDLVKFNWREVNQNIVLDGDQELSTELSLVNLGHLIWVVGLRPEIEPIILSLWLDYNDDVVIKAILLRLQICVSIIRGDGFI